MAVGAIRRVKGRSVLQAMAVLCKMLGAYSSCPLDALMTGAYSGMDLGIQLSGEAMGERGRSEQIMTISAPSELTSRPDGPCWLPTEHEPSHTMV